MAAYTHEYSHFPDALITLKHYKDVTDENAGIINTYRKYIQNGQYDSAAAYAKRNSDFFDSCLVGNNTLMTLQEEIRNTQILALKRCQSIRISDTEPEVIETGDVWIGGLHE